MKDTELFTANLQNTFKNMVDHLESEINSLHLVTDKDILALNNTYESLTDTKEKLQAIAACAEDFAEKLHFTAEDATGAANRCGDILRNMQDLVDINVITVNTESELVDSAERRKKFKLR